MGKNLLKIAIILALVSLCWVQAKATMASPSAVFGAGAIYSGGNANFQSVVNDLKTSGFTRVIAWAVHVDSAGDLIYNGPMMIQNGQYVADAAWPGYLNQLKKAPTSINSLEFSIGGYGVGDFGDIAALVSSQGTGPTSTLYKNFKALKTAIPSIDSIDFDDEDDYDENAVIQFSLMLGTLGYKVTYCPYMYQSFWTDCLQSVNAQSPGLVTAFNLQCYAGGAGNDPGQWQSAVNSTGYGVPVYPGLWIQQVSALQSEDTFASWASEGVPGGFLYLYDNLSGLGQANGYANSIEAGLLAGHTYNVLNNNSGLALNIPGGSNTTGLQLNQLAQNQAQSQSWTFNYLGSNVFNITSASNGLYLDDFNSLTAPGTAVDQNSSNGNANQKWTLTLNQNQTFRLQNQQSNLFAAVIGGSATNGTGVDQEAYNSSGMPSADWAIVGPGLPDPDLFYDILNVNSSKAAVPQVITNPIGSPIVQGQDDGSSVGNWQFQPAGNGSYFIVNRASGLSLDNPGASLASGTVLDQVANTLDLNQEWTLTPTGSGSVTIQNRWSTLMMDVLGASLLDGASIAQQYASGATSQKWQLLLSTSTFNLSASPASESVNQGSTSTSTISVAPAGSFSNSVTFSASGLPNGVTASFSPTSSPTSTVVTFTATTTASLGTSAVTITGTSGGLTSSTTMQLTVSPNFLLSASPATITVNQRTSVTSNVTVTPNGSFAGAVFFTISGLPNGVTASFSPTVSASGSVLTLTAAAAATTGPATLTITGTSGVFTEQATIALTVAGNYTLSANPTSLSINQRTSGSTAVSVSTTGGFTNSVIFTTGALPSGVTASFAPSTSPTSTVVTFSASDTAATGTSVVNIVGLDGSLSNSTPIQLTILGNYKLSASPNVISLKQNQLATSTIAIADQGGFTSSATFSISGLPAGVTATFSPTSSTSGSTLTLSASPTAAMGAATLTVTATSGTLSNTTTIAFSVIQGWNVTAFNVSPTTVVGGSPVAGTVTLSDPAPAGGEPVTLSVPKASAGYLSLPAITVPAGQTTLNFAGIQTHTVIATNTVTISASVAASSQSASLTISFVSGGAQAGGLQFFSLPWGYNDKLANIFEFAPPSGQIAGYNPLSFSYTYEGGSLANPTNAVIAPGVGYWALFPAQGETLLYLGTPASATTPTTVKLYPGYNAIGDPYTAPVNISSLEIGTGKTTITKSAGVVSPTLYYYAQNLSAASGGSYVATASTDSLIPGKGYWIYAYAATTLTFPQPINTAPPPPTSTVHKGF